MKCRATFANGTVTGGRYGHDRCPNHADVERIASFGDASEWAITVPLCMAHAELWDDATKGIQIARFASAEGS